MAQLPAVTGRHDPRRGHGLEVVRSVAAAHGGRFILRRSPVVTIAVLELPLADPGPPIRSSMSRRGRALAFLLGALACAGLAAALAGGYESSVAEQLGELRSVVVARERLPAREEIEAREARRALEVRRVPDRFAPADALAAPEEAIGLEPAADLMPGSYLVSGQLAAPRRRERAPADASLGLSPIELEVTGAGALAASSGGGGAGVDVDVVVTSEPGPGGRGRTYIAADGVELLALAEGGTASPEDDPLASAGTPPVYTATLAVGRADALKLIQAENFARQVRLIPAR